MSRRLLGLALAGALAAAAIAAGGAALRDSSERRGAGGSAGAAVTSSPTARADDRRLGPTHPETKIDLSLSLRTRRAAVAAYLRAVNDPDSPSYRHFLTPAAFGARFGLPPRTIADVRRRLEAHGFHVLTATPQRTSLEVRATAAAVRKYFGVRLVDFADSKGRRYHSAAGAPVIPAELAGKVVAVAGLDTKLAPQAADVPTRRCGPIRNLSPCSGLAPEDIARAYDITPLHERGIQGQGQTIAILSLDSFNEEDVAAFDRQFGISGPPVEKVTLEGPVPVGGGSVEVNLDIDTIRGVAPKAQILDYEAENSLLNMARLVDKIVADKRADIVSVSWGLCDSFYFDGPPDARRQQLAIRQRILDSLAAAAAAGVSVFVASGDAGAYDCQRADFDDHRLSVDNPSTSAHVISVGGTLLSLRQDGSYLEEAGWEDHLSNAGGGGGLSLTEARPRWQRGPGVDNEFSTGKRQIPDVSAAADADSGFLFVHDGNLQVGGGTSEAAPFWAAVTALVGQLAEREDAGELGFVAPVLYDVARTSAGRDAFHDVTRGGIRYYRAAPGWDYATGLGSPDVTNLARAVVQYLKQND